MDQSGLSSIVPALLKVVEWLVVPLVLVILWAYGFSVLPNKAPLEATRAAARHARWAGMILLVLFVISRKGRPDILALELPEYEFHWLTTLAGALTGYFFSWFIEKIRHAVALSAVVLILVASMAISLYSYFFISDVRVGILFSALGFALGTLLDKAFSARSRAPRAKRKEDPGEVVREQPKAEK